MIQLYTVYMRHFRFQNTNRLKVKGLEKIYQANSNQEGAEMAILISDKIDLKTKIVTRDKISK